MRLLHLNAGNLYGGIETMLVTLARFRGEAPELEQRFALCFPDRLAEELSAAGTPPEIMGPARASRPWTVWRARRALRALLARERFDAVACHGSWSLGLFGSTVRASRPRVILWAHSPGRGPNWLERLADRARPNLVIANSRFTAEGLRGRFPGAAVEVLYPPVAPSPPMSPDERDAARASLGAGPEDVVILVASRLERLKGLHLLVEALGSLRGEPRWVCWIAGAAQRATERRYFTDVREACGAGGIAERVHFLGERRDVRTIMAAADVFCQANVEPDAFGMSLVEAMYAGLPVVTTAMGGALEVVDGNTGLVVTSEPRAVADALRRLIDDRSLREALAHAGPGRAARLSGPATQVRRLRHVLGARTVREGGSHRGVHSMKNDVLHNLVRRLVPRPIRNLARSPRSSLLWASHQLAYRLDIRRHCTIAEGWTVNCHPAAAHAFRSHLRDDEFQRELAVFREHSCPSMRLIDVGAHYGVFTLAALHYRPEARVVAVDPSRVAVRVLRVNVALTGSGDRVEVVESAVGAKEGTLPMLSTGPASTHYMVVADSTRPDARSIALTTLGALAARFPGGPTHVKIDVEGFEEDVIRGGSVVLAQLRPVVYLELHGAMIRRRGGDPRAPLHLMANLGYRRFESGGHIVTANSVEGRDLVRLVCLPG